MLRTSQSLYLKILPDPTLILYFLKYESTGKDIQEWINILKVENLNSKLVFISYAGTYLEREKTIIKISK
jgi:hypothetical protein